MKQKQLLKFYNESINQYTLIMKDNNLEEEYLKLQFKKGRFRGKMVGILLLIYQIVYMIISFNQNISQMDKEFIIPNGLVTLLYVLTSVSQYLKYQFYCKVYPIMISTIFIIFAFNQYFLHYYVHQFHCQTSTSNINSRDSSLVSNSTDPNLSNNSGESYKYDNIIYDSEIKGLSLAFIALALVGCVEQFRYRLLLLLQFILTIYGQGIYFIEGIYERAHTFISCSVSISIIIIYFYLQERSFRLMYLDSKRGQNSQDIIDRLIPSSIISAKFDSIMSRLSFTSSNTEAQRNLGVNNESNFQQFMESCQIDKLDNSPFLSTTDFDSTIKKLSNNTGQLSLKQICKELIVRQKQQNQQQQKRSSTWQQNLDTQNQFKNRTSGTMQQLTSGCIPPSPLLNKSKQKGNQFSRGSVRIFDTKPQNTSSRRTLTVAQTNYYSQNPQYNSLIGLQSQNEIKQSGILLLNGSDQPTTHNLNSVNKANFSCFSGQILQEDGISKKVNIRIWTYRLIYEYVVVSIEDQSFKQQFNVQKEKNTVMQYFLSYFISKQEEFSKISLVQQKLAYCNIRNNFRQNSKQKTNENFQYLQKKKTTIQLNFDNQDAISILDSPNLVGHQRQDSHNNSLNINQSNFWLYSPQIQLNQLRLSQVNSPNQLPISNTYLNTDMCGSQFDEINLEFITDDRKAIFSSKNQPKTMKKKIANDGNILFNGDGQVFKFNEIESKNTQQNVGQQNDNTYQYSLEQNFYVQASKGDISISASDKVQVLIKSKSLSPQRNQQQDGQNQNVPKKSFTQTPKSFKNIQRSLSYDQFSNAFQQIQQNQSNQFINTNLSPIRDKHVMQQLGLIKFKTSQQDDSEEELMNKKRIHRNKTVNYTNQKIQNNQYQFQPLQQANLLIQDYSQIINEGNLKPSYFQGQTKQQNEEFKNMNEDQEKNQNITITIKSIEKSQFYIYQSKYMSQNYKLLQGILFTQKSFKYSLCQTHILDILKGILQICNPLIEQKKLKISIHEKNIDEESLKNLQQDKEKLTILLFNILFNSLSYCKKNSQVFIQFHQALDLKEYDNQQNSILINDQISSCTDIQQNNYIKEDENHKDISNQYNTIGKSQNAKSLTQIQLSSPSKPLTNNIKNENQHQSQKRTSISYLNTKDNQLDPNQLKLTILNEVETYEQQTAIQKIEDANKNNAESILQQALQLIQSSNYQEKEQNQLNCQETAKATFTKAIPQMGKRHTQSNFYSIREPSNTVFNQNSILNNVKIGIVVSKYILRKIGPYEKITYSSQGNNQIKTELIIYKDLRHLEPEQQSLKTRQTVYSYAQSQGSQQNIPFMGEQKSKFYNNNISQNNTLIINKNNISKTQTLNPVLDQFNETNFDKYNKEDENSISKQFIDQKIKKKYIFGEQPIYFEDINERDKHNSSIVSEDYSRASIPIERLKNNTLVSQIHKTHDIKNMFCPY